MVSKQQIIQGFVQHAVGEFEVDQIYKPVELHKKFVRYIKVYPIDARHKYLIMFGQRTKTDLRNYLLNDLGLQYVPRRAGYYIHHDPEYCTNLNNKLWSRPPTIPYANDS